VARRQQATNRLFYNFNSNTNGFYFDNNMANTSHPSLPSSPAHESVLGKLSTASVNSSTPSTPRMTRKMPTDAAANAQPMLKMLKQKANLFTGSVTACGGGAGAGFDTSEFGLDSRPTIVHSAVSQHHHHHHKSKESILNRLFNRSKSKEKSQQPSNSSNQDAGMNLTSRKLRSTNELANTHATVNSYYYREQTKLC
jgi:hypothetical protein